MIMDRTGQCRCATLLDVPGWPGCFAAVSGRGLRLFFSRSYTVSRLPGSRRAASYGLIACSARVHGPGSAKTRI